MRRGRLPHPGRWRFGRGAVRSDPAAQDRTGGLFAAGILALVGLPPFGLFISEFLLIRAAMLAGHPEVRTATRPARVDTDGDGIADVDVHDPT